MIPQNATAAPAPSPTAMPASIPQTVVLDTNVLLDLFVFHDPRWQALHGALQSGRVRAVTRADCDQEWLLVLQYPQLPLDDTRRAASLAAYRALITVGSFAAKSGIVLPRCSDADDQKFLELARDAAAQVLISKDKAVLKLARKTAQAGLFRILPPEKWVAEFGHADGHTDGY